jgi:hypothetical protein
MKNTALARQILKPALVIDCKHQQRFDRQPSCKYEAHMIKNVIKRKYVQEFLC